MKTIVKDQLRVEVYETREAMGQHAGNHAAALLCRLLSEQEEVNVIFAAAPSQNEMLDMLQRADGIDWGRVNAFHMDEYVGLPADAPQSFGRFLRERIFDKLPFRCVHYLNGQAMDVEAECERYTALLQRHPTDVVLLGIGENGHIAFNDPHVADFCDPLTVKRVSLDDVCRNQQVNDGCFGSIDEVPHYALTLTIPALTAARHMVCTVPAKTKAWAVDTTVNGEINEACPATIMRNHPDAVIFCDYDSGRNLL